MKYAVITFGCRVNQADSLAFEEQLLARGAVAGSLDEAEVVMVNTCSVTASADQAARQAIRRLARINPHARVVVTGCYATRRPDEIQDLPGVTHVVPNVAKETAVPLLWRDASGASVTTASRADSGEGSCGATVVPGVAGRTAFTLRVQTGCAESCSYCIIPTTRGTPKSVSPDRVIEELHRVIEAGFKEVAITGVHLGSYGRDLSPPFSLSALLARLEQAIAGHSVLLRISSLEPMDCTPEVVRLIARGTGFAPHFHLPLQHASNRMLAAMCRPYSLEDFATLVGTIRDEIPHAAIGSDIIIGFPGETDEDFAALTGYLETSPLTHLHVFPYSDRPGTVASGLVGKVAGPIVRERARQVREISERLGARFRAAMQRTIHRALTIDDGSTVVTGNYLKLRVPAGRARNEWVKVRVGMTDGTLVGEFVEVGASPIC